MNIDTTIHHEIQTQYKLNKRVGFIDEVGRGALAGPLCTACAVLNHDFFNDPRIDDSKLINKHNMNTLARVIKDNIMFWGIGVVTIKELNKMQNLHKATLLAMKRSVLVLPREYKPHALYIDGPHAIPDLHIEQHPVIAGDAKIYGIACASIIAKDFRDTYMKLISEGHEAYLWCQNAGYGTKDHLEAIKDYGLTKHHRLWFKNIQGGQVHVNSHQRV